MELTSAGQHIVLKNSAEVYLKDTVNSVIDRPDKETILTKQVIPIFWFPLYIKVTLYCSLLSVQQQYV